MELENIYYNMISERAISERAGDSAELITKLVKPLTDHLVERVNKVGWNVALADIRRTVEKAANDASGKLGSPIN